MQDDIQKLLCLKEEELFLSHRYYMGNWLRCHQRRGRKKYMN